MARAVLVLAGVMSTFGAAHPSNAHAGANGAQVFFAEPRPRPAEFPATAATRLHFVALDPAALLDALVVEGSPVWAAPSSGCASLTGRSIAVRTPVGDTVTLAAERASACGMGGTPVVRWEGRVAGSSGRGTLTLNVFPTESGRLQVVGIADFSNGTWSVSPTSDPRTYVWAPSSGRICEPSGPDGELRCDRADPPIPPLVVTRQPTPTSPGGTSIIPPGPAPQVETAVGAAPIATIGSFTG